MMTVMNFLTRYTNWLHGRWPAGRVDRLPVVRDDGTTNVPGLWITGDLTGVPLLKFAVDSGAKAARAVAADLAGDRGVEMPDVAIIGGGVSGIAAAIEARRLGLSHRVYDSAEAFSTIANFPRAKPIYAYPVNFTPEGDFQVHATVKEDLLAELQTQRKSAGIEVVTARVECVERKEGGFLIHRDGGTTDRARRVIVAIGRSGNFRKLGVPGENLDKVANRLHDPKEFEGRNVLVVGGGDSALEAAIALAECGADVTLSHRGRDFSRAKSGNVERLGLSLVTQALDTTVREITAESVILSDRTIPNDAVFALIGREAPLDFFRRSGVAISGEWHIATWITFLAFFAACSFVYLWKGGTTVNAAFKANHWFPYNLPDLALTNPFGQALSVSIHEPGFYYSFLYCALIVIFGFRRMARRKTPYVEAQTWSLMLVQCIPLFVLPYIVLPAMGHAGWFNEGLGKTLADNLFPAVSQGQGREYWRAFGLILAWPLFIWNVFTAQPLWWWLVISLVQTFVIIPLIVWRWGKGAYCGWICSCGALAETLGDEQRRKMPHGPFWNRLNMVGQVILGVAGLLFALRVLSWAGIQPLDSIYAGLLSGWSVLGIQINYYQVVDVFLAGTVGVAAYFWFSGRVWCRFACPLAALMHIYARFSRFRIFPEKSKCISCNVCTSVCHQGIDVMNFANKGLPMEDPECVRCSACVQGCPTGVLAFGRLDGAGAPVLDRLAASPVRASVGRPG